MTIDDVVRRLNDGLDRTEEELEMCKKWLLEFQVANQMTLRELDDLCFEDCDWVFDNIFGKGDKIMKYALVGYNKDNDIYGVIETHEDLEYLKLKGKDVTEIQKATDSFCVDGYKEPFDWFEIVDANDVEYPNVCYWTSYEEDADTDDDMRYNPLQENLTKLLELSEQVLTVAYDNEDNHLEYLAHELKTTIEYMMEDFDL